MLITVYSDATATLGLIGNDGLGRARHIDVGVLWLQQRRLKQEIAYGKVAGTENCTDLFTKHVPREKLEKFVGDLGYRLEGGRAQGAMELYEVTTKQRKTMGKTVTFQFE